MKKEVKEFLIERLEDHIAGNKQDIVNSQVRLDSAYKDRDTIQEELDTINEVINDRTREIDRNMEENLDMKDAITDLRLIKDE